MNQEEKLTAKQPEVIFYFNEQTSSYESKLTLSNLSQQPLYYRILSTFGKLLTYQNHQSRKIQPFKTIIFNLKLKIPNQIKKNQEKIQISYSKKQISSKIKFLNDAVFDIGITFDQNLPDQDQMITQILKADCQELCRQGAELIKTGFIKKALYKYEQSFLLYRQHSNSLYGMAQCHYLMLQWNEALEQIQTALLLHQNQNYDWLKLKIVFEIYKDEPNNLQMIRTLKKLIGSLTDIGNNEQKKKQMMDFLTKEEEKIMSEKGGKITYEFIEKALKRYEDDQHIKTLYPDFQHYEKQVFEVLGVRTSHTIEQTPEFVLDPITYQIMSQPLIVPSGHSYEKKSLLAYISNHGNKDLYTRQQLRYEWAKPNNALQRYIQKSPHLHQWVSYEKEITTFK